MSLKDTYGCAFDKADATINAAASLSDGVKLGGLRLFGLVIPDTWADAKVSFQASFEGDANFYDLRDKDGEVAYSVTAGSYLVLEAEKFASIQQIKIRSGLSTAPVVQSSGAIVRLILRTI